MVSASDNASSGIPVGSGSRRVIRPAIKETAASRIRIYRLITVMVSHGFSCDARPQYSCGFVKRTVISKKQLDQFL